jgi:hypothetical protein
MKVVIRSGKLNWDGRGFDTGPAKVYSDFEDALSSLNSFHFYTFDREKCEYIPCEKYQPIEFNFISDEEATIEESKPRRPPPAPNRRPT